MRPGLYHFGALMLAKGSQLILFIMATIETGNTLIDYKESERISFFLGAFMIIFLLGEFILHFHLYWIHKSPRKLRVVEVFSTFIVLIAAFMYESATIFKRDYRDGKIKYYRIKWECVVMVLIAVFLQFFTQFVAKKIVKITETVNPLVEEENAEPPTEMENMPPATGSGNVEPANQAKKVVHFSHPNLETANQVKKVVHFSHPNSEPATGAEESAKGKDFVTVIKVPGNAKPLNNRDYEEIDDVSGFLDSSV